MRFSSPAVIWCVIMAVSLSVLNMSCDVTGIMPNDPISLSYLSNDGIKPILATTNLSVGERRISFLLTDSTGIVKSETVTLKVKHIGRSDSFDGISTARYYDWPYGRGAYTAMINFDEPGYWQMDIYIDDRNQLIPSRLIEWVDRNAMIPDVGSIPPKSLSKTFSDSTDIADITTAANPDTSLYDITVRKALSNQKPSVIAFASPAFCTSPTCGPQVEALSQLKNSYDYDLNFIHVEIYDNPQDIQGDFDVAEVAPAVKEWKLDTLPGWKNESWTFVLDRNGQIRHRFEGFVSSLELEQAVDSVIVN